MAQNMALPFALESIFSAGSIPNIPPSEGGEQNS